MNRFIQYVLLGMLWLMGMEAQGAVAARICWPTNDAQDVGGYSAMPPADTEMRYTVNEVVEGRVVHSTQGTAMKDSSVVVPYHYYNLQDGRLYKRLALEGNKNREFNHFFTVTEDGQTETLDYDWTDIDNVVFLSEGEDLPGMAVCTSGNSVVRSSHAAAAYPADGPVDIVTLPRGRYRIGAVLFCSKKTPDENWQIMNGSQVVAELHCSVVNFQEVTSDEIVLTQTSTLSIAQGGDNNSGIDLIYIQKIGDVDFVLPDGRYYLRNVATGRYWGAANDWGSRASLVVHPEFCTLVRQPDGSYFLQSQLLRQDYSYFNGEWMDADPVGLTIREVGDGIVTIAQGDGYFGYNGEDYLLNTGGDGGSEQAWWQTLTEKDLRATMDNATTDNPADATFLFLDPDFSRNHRYQGAWTGDDFTVGGNASNMNAEKWGGNSQTFDISQTAEVPNGIYRISWNGFYRYNNKTENTNSTAVSAHADGTEIINSFVYLNNNDFPLISIADEQATEVLGDNLPFSQSDASDAFGQGLYAQTGQVVVTDGRLTIGIKKTAHPGCDWTVWDNFEVYYLGDGDNLHHYRQITENTTLLTTVSNIEEERMREDWIEGGTTQADQYGTVNPENGQEGFNVVEKGVLLKKGNSNKTLKTYVTGVEAVWAYGCTAGSTSRDIVVTASDFSGYVVATARATSVPTNSVVVRLSGLDPDMKYTIDFTGEDPETGAGADVALHGVRFVVKDYEEKTFTVSNIIYHTTSDDEVEVVGHGNLTMQQLTMFHIVSNGGKTYYVTSIATQGMAGCWDVAGLRLPARLKHIGYQAFAFSGYETIRIPASTTDIDDQAFILDERLTAITVSESNPNYTAVDGVLFSKDMTELICYPVGHKGNWYDIPASVRTLDVSAFRGTRLEYVLLPAQLDNSWWAPFESCTSLKNVVCLRPTPARWNRNTFDDGIYSQATLWVPQEYVADYRTVSPWSNFQNIKAIPNAVTVSVKNYTVNYGDKIPTSFDFNIGDGPWGGEPKIVCQATDNSDAGTYAISIQPNSIHSISELSIQDGQLLINKVPLDVSVPNYTKKQGDPVPSFSVTYSGFVKGQSEQDLTRKATAACNATASSAPGTYPINVAGAESPNYTFRYHPGVLTVTAADAIVVTAKSYTIYYGDNFPTFDYDVSGGQLNGTPSITCNAGERPAPGIYDIVITKGTATNYNITCINGKLTVLKAPLQVWVDNYEKFADEENPVFTIHYSGFKYSQNEAWLTKKPTAQCDARLGSPAGVYPIVVSGAESANYSFSYTDGKLTVKPVFNLNISTVGNGKVQYDGHVIESYAHFNVRQGQPVSVSILPASGYELVTLMHNGEDVTQRVSAGTYSFASMTEDVNLVATFGESQGSFTYAGVMYHILSAPGKTVIVGKTSLNSEHLVIPSEVTSPDGKWKVVGLADLAFSDCTELVSIELPASLEQENTGSSLFTGCTALAAIIWKASFQMTNAMMGVVDNPNLLFYANAAGMVPSGIDNVVVGGTAERILLTDDGGNSANFWCPQAFTAKAISYTHNYSMTSAIGSIGGWETLALPFTVATVTHSSQGTIIPFAKYSGQSQQKPFWLYTYSSSGFIRSQAIEAYKPYIICMPNNEEYEPEYRLSGNVTFAAANVRVEPTANAIVQRRGQKAFVPVFCEKRQAASVYALNVVNDQHNQTGGYSPGSVFVSNLRSVSPFEAYLTTNAAGARLVAEIDFEQSTAIADLLLVPGDIILPANIYNLRGQRVARASSMSDLEKVVRLLSPGEYIVNGKKIQIK